MRKTVFAVIIVFTVLIAVAMLLPAPPDKSEFVRIRIIANSDSPFDQNVKLALRNKLIDYLEPLLENAGNREEATEIISRNKSDIQKFCDSLLSGAASYGCSVALRNELFPDRTYNGEIYPAGEYVSLVITLGKGEGGNWWCMAYPPLCFINGRPDPDSPDTVTYRSLLLEWLYELLGK